MTNSLNEEEIVILSSELKKLNDEERSKLYDALKVKVDSEGNIDTEFFHARIFELCTYLKDEEANKNRQHKFIPTTIDIIDNWIIENKEIAFASSKSLKTLLYSGSFLMSERPKKWVNSLSKYERKVLGFEEEGIILDYQNWIMAKIVAEEENALIIGNTKLGKKVGVWIKQEEKAMKEAAREWLKKEGIEDKKEEEKESEKGEKMRKRM
ncbi:MAG: hypothetical protein FWF23_02945 [Alphaproteobacteria bacterium]|nr:hypothetical protein [Alphaproteobacteria bacterium]MCL2505488.1 hypothetical protein [Alphaproteobacteria bacterium]